MQCHDENEDDDDDDLTFLPRQYLVPVENELSALKWK